MATDLTTYIDNKKSFFLYAGAGSGKTYVLVELLKYIKTTRKEVLEQAHQKVAVITYTNAATDEIKRRIGFDTLFDISTIHSFVWEMIHPYQEDIKKLMTTHLQENIEDLEQKQLRLKDKQCKTYLDRQGKIDKYKGRLETVKSVTIFIYNPNGDNANSDSLSHSEVITIGAELFRRPLLQRIMVQRYPFIMIDESQDTRKEILIAMLEMAKNNEGRLTMGLFGDVKQRIYLDGLPDIESHIPDGWERPVLKNNYRSDSRIVRLTNLIAKEMQAEDISKQIAQRTEGNGCIRLYLVQYTESLDQEATEKAIIEDMAIESNDDNWRDEMKVKTLLLEHRMAAVRLGFEGFYDKFYNVGRYSEDFIKGEVADMSVFMEVVFPILEAHNNGDKERVFEIVQDNCIMLSKRSFLSVKQMKDVGEKVKSIISLCNNEKCTIERAVDCVVNSNLFLVSPMLTALVKEGADKDFTESQTHALEAWKQAKDLPLTQFYQYFEYVTERSRFATHQGVKGLEFDRVMAIYDDASARGKIFSYEKTFGASALSDVDVKNMNEGKENSVQRTMRLLYVTCSRAKQSLALVAYTGKPQVIHDFCKEKEWFEEREIITWPRN